MTYSTDYYIAGRELLFSPFYALLIASFWGILYLSVKLFKPEKAYYGLRNYEIMLEIQEEQKSLRNAVMLDCNNTAEALKILKNMNK